MWPFCEINQYHFFSNLWVTTNEIRVVHFSSLSSYPSLDDEASRIAFLRLCILNSLFYAAWNELEKISGPPLNGVVTSERCSPAIYTRGAVLNVTARCATRDTRRVLRFTSRISDVRPEKRALLFGRHAAGTMPFTVSLRGPVRLLHPTRRNMPKIRLCTAVQRSSRWIARDARIMLRFFSSCELRTRYLTYNYQRYELPNYLTP